MFVKKLMTYKVQHRCKLLRNIFLQSRQSKSLFIPVPLAEGHLALHLEVCACLVLYCDREHL